jgi:16S rRNA (cytosine967-C5)-methyltransferase
VLQRIDHEGAYANLVLPPALARSGLSERDRRFVTDLVYGTVRMRRACDVLVDRFVATAPDPAVRTVLRLGAYQLHFLGIAPHAAVGETVSAAPPRARGFVNAVLRKVASAGEPRWPSDAARLSYPDWLAERLVTELGADAAREAMERMNLPPEVNVRADGYVQDPASQWVAEAVGSESGELVADLCAAPGGKSTAMGSTGAHVIAADLQFHRARLVVANARTLDQRLPVLVSDATRPALRPGVFDRVLLDAPCSGLGALRRRPDGRWRISSSDIADLAALQARMIPACAELVRPGGVLVYSVCTLTAAESIDHPVPAGFVPLEPPGGPWIPYGDGARLLPQTADTDGMTIRRWRRIES